MSYVYTQNNSYLVPSEFWNSENLEYLKKGTVSISESPEMQITSVRCLHPEIGSTVTQNLLFEVIFVRTLVITQWQT